MPIVALIVSPSWARPMVAGEHAGEHPLGRALLDRRRAADRGLISIAIRELRWLATRS
jgi:hypothetical protein